MTLEEVIDGLWRVQNALEAGQMEEPSHETRGALYELARAAEDAVRVGRGEKDQVELSEKQEVFLRGLLEEVEG